MTNNFDAIRAKIEALKSALPQLIEEAAKTEMAAILDAAKARVPVESGALRDSGQVVMDNGVPTIVFDTPYAARIHEDMELSHDKHGGRSKYLESAILEKARGMDQRVGDRITQGMKEMV